MAASSNPAISVYLAELARDDEDCRACHAQVKKVLADLGAQVVPTEPLDNLPPDANLEEAISRALSSAAFSIHLFSERYGDRYHRDQRSIVQLQSDLAKKEQIDRLVWVPKGVTSDAIATHAALAADEKESRTNAVRSGIYRQFLRGILDEPRELFISYASETVHLRRELVAGLSVLKKKLHTWDDRHLQAGEEWGPAIWSHLTSADLVVLLLSSHFFASPRCAEEWHHAEQRPNGRAEIVPVLGNACAWRQDPNIAKYNLRPTSPIEKEGRIDNQAVTEAVNSIAEVEASARPPKESKLHRGSLGEFTHAVTIEVSQRTIGKLTRVMGEATQLSADVKEQKSAKRTWRKRFFVATLVAAVALVVLGIWWYRADNAERLQAGMDHLERGDVSGALVWFASVPDKARQHHARLGAAVNQHARLALQLPHDGLRFVEFRQDGKYVLTAGQGAETERQIKFWGAIPGDDGQKTDLALPADGPVNSAEWSLDPQGKFLAVASGDASPLLERSKHQPEALQPGKIEVWTWNETTKTWSDQPRTLANYKGLPTYAVFGRNDTQWHLVITSHRVDTTRRSTEVLVWDLENNKDFIDIKDLDRLQLSGDSIVDYAAFSPGGNYIVTRRRAYEGDDAIAQVWHRPKDKDETGQPSRNWIPKTPPLPHDDDITHVAVSPDGLLALTTSADRTARVWDVDTGKRLAAPGSRRPIELRHGDVVNHGAFSPDSQMVVTCSRDNSAVVWEARTGVAVASLIHGSWVNRVGFSPDGRRVLTASRDRTVQVWDVATQERVVPPLHHGGAVSFAKFSPDGRQVLTRSEHLARVWELETSNPRPTVITTTAPAYVGSSPEGRNLVSCEANPSGGTYRTRVWKAAGGASQELSDDRKVEYAQFSPAGHLLLTWTPQATAQGGSAVLWDLSGAQPRKTAEWESAPIPLAAFSEQASDEISHLLIVEKTVEKPTGNGPEATRWHIHVRRHDPADPDAAKSPLTGREPYDKAILHAAFAPAAPPVFAVAVDAVTQQGHGGAHVWEITPSDDRHSARLAKRQQVAHDRDKQGNLQEGGEAVTFVTFNHDGTRLVTAGEDDTARAWDMETGEQKSLLEHEADVVHVAIGPEYLVTSSFDQTARLWKLDSDAEPLVLRHTSRVNRAAISGNGDLIATAGYDGKARIWDLEGKLVAILPTGLDVRYAWFGFDGHGQASHAWEDLVVTVSYAPLPPILSADAPAVRGASPAPHVPRLVQTNLWRLSPAWGDDRDRTRDYGSLYAAREVRWRGWPVPWATEVNLAPLPAAATTQVWNTCRLDPGRPEPRKETIQFHSQEAQLAEANGQWFAAQWQLERALKLAGKSPQSAQLLRRQAVVHSALGQWESAVEHYDAALKHQEDWQLRQAMADAAAQQSQLEPQLKEAIEYYTQAITRAGADRPPLPDDRNALPSEKRALLERRAWLYRRLRQGKKAREDYDQALIHDPQNGWLYAKRAEVSVQEGNWEAAVTDYKNGIRIDRPREQYARRLFAALGDVYRQANQWQAAVGAYEEALKKPRRTDADPSDESLYDWLGQAYLQRAQPLIADKLSQYRQPPPGGAPENEELSLAKLMDRAVENLAKAVERRPEDAALAMRYATAQLAHDRLCPGDSEGYPVVRQQILESFRDTSLTLEANIVAWTCSLADGPLDESLSSLPQQLAAMAVRQEPEVDPQRYLNTLGAALYRAGKYDQAYRRLQEARDAYTGEAKREATPRREAGTVWDWLFLAMVCHRAQEADQPISAEGENDRADETDPGYWRDLVESNRQRLQAEAAPQDASQLQWYQEWQLMLLHQELNDMLDVAAAENGARR